MLKIQNIVLRCDLLIKKAKYRIIYYNILLYIFIPYSQKCMNLHNILINTISTS